MIIVDVSNIMNAQMRANVKDLKEKTTKLQTLRYMMLISLRKIKRNFSNKYGQIVVAFDSQNTWRKDIFPYYKIRRGLKKEKEKYPINWNEYYENMDILFHELKEVLPYKFVKTARCEADDIIAHFCTEYGTYLGNKEKILIISGDRDFVQFQKYSNVEQYDSVRDTFKTVEDPIQFLFEEIARGQAKDDIPNVLSDDDHFAVPTGKRQTPINKNRLDEFKKELPENWQRNENLIDLEKIPEEYKEAIKASVPSEVPTGKQLYSYFIKHKLRKFLEEGDNQF